MPAAERPLARVFRPSPAAIALLARKLRAGEIVGVPTETVYGLAGNAFDAAACRKIFRAKGRPTNDPLIVHLHSPAQLTDVCEPNASALRVARAFWPGPLTIVLPKRREVPDLITAGRPSVAVRIPSHRVFRRLLKRAALPLAAPSANPFGYISPTSAEHVRDNLGKKIRYILDGGTSTIGLESTILDLRNEAKPRLLRPGAISREQLEQVLGRKVALPPRRTSRGEHALVAPGTLARHYSPRTPVTLHARIDQTAAPKQAYVFMRKPRGRIARNVFWLDAHGRLDGVARRLFAMLRQLDRAGFERIHVELASGESGLAAAINDRLRRAAAR